ncbi:MAG: YciI family protein [Anaerolineaceae bacterium]|nr:YciI family protein [Anaerolineaceae bacterium]
MKYLCLAYQDEQRLDALSREEMDALIEETLAYNEELRRSGHLIAAEALQGVRTAVILRVRDGRLSVTDGPFVETKEQLGGFFLINARDLNEAILVASRMVPARVGCLEVRPIRELTGAGRQDPGREAEQNQDV